MWEAEACKKPMKRGYGVANLQWLGRGEVTVHVEIHENCEDCDVKFSNTLKSFRGIRKVTVLSKYNYIVTASKDFDLNLLGAHLFKNTGRSVKLVPTATCHNNDTWKECAGVVVCKSDACSILLTCSYAFDTLLVPSTKIEVTNCSFKTFSAHLVYKNEHINLGVLRIEEDLGDEVVASDLYDKPIAFGAVVYSITAPNIDLAPLVFALAKGLVHHPSAPSELITSKYKGTGILFSSKGWDNGACGGPLFDSEGRLIGIYCGMYDTDDYVTYHFAQSLGSVLNFLKQEQDIDMLDLLKSYFEVGKAKVSLEGKKN
ncbi:hypothetical protein DM860_017867 [Cuscuta australis]|uniref:Peptidase S1 domain-containing protein n=1 Tax=Cuscuta australis TaxID=267555 RepID=A0A328DRP5_9ASTE|nr:hypothetical protein DM860_017867 [Cuscuta australis]